MTFEIPWEIYAHDFTSSFVYEENDKIARRVTKQGNLAKFRNAGDLLFDLWLWCVNNRTRGITLAAKPSFEGGRREKSAFWDSSLRTIFECQSVRSEFCLRRAVSRRERVWDVKYPLKYPQKGKTKARRCLYRINRCSMYCYIQHRCRWHMTAPIGALHQLLHSSRLTIRSFRPGYRYNNVPYNCSNDVFGFAYATIRNPEFCI